MVAEARLKSKNLYKVELYLLKIMPMVIALAYLVNTVSSYFGVDIPILASIAGMSLIPLIFMYISSYVFKFCEYHRMFLHYIAVNDIINIYDLKEGGSRGELSTKSLAKMSESLKRGYSEFPERREKIRNKALGRKMPKDTRCKISLNHSKSNLLKINDEVGSIRYWALKIGKAHSVLSYRLKVHGIDNLRKYIEQRIKLV